MAAGYDAKPSRLRNTASRRGLIVQANSARVSHSREQNVVHYHCNRCARLKAFWADLPDAIQCKSALARSAHCGIALLVNSQPSSLKIIRGFLSRLMVPENAVRFRLDGPGTGDAAKAFADGEPRLDSILMETRAEVGTAEPRVQLALQ